MIHQRIETELILAGGAVSSYLVLFTTQPGLKKILVLFMSVTGVEDGTNQLHCSK